ncbi:C-X-C motif chemokine 13 [Xenopus tropicalis]|uniref:C-X-C motif chemokine 13 n=1 Tax=Xenopus tropicalis TaxID=8364 RepID=A0A8J1IZC8_XENTR|nr:C-X-C motif chemokine 13 [Xenopus tropicalis]
MRWIAVLLCLALLLEGCSLISGFPWESLMVGRKCRCLKQTKKRPSSIYRIQVFPESYKCRTQEVLVFLKNKQIVCVDPEARWIQVLIFNSQKERGEKN